MLSLLYTVVNSIRGISYRSLPKVVILSGPTAVGKTDISIELAKRLNGEIISADPVQAYTKLNIGSNKITKEEQQGISHHLIDFIDYQREEEYSTAEFYELCVEKIKDIHSRKKVPIIVGGTGFYVRWLVEGRPTTPAPNEEEMKLIDKLVDLDQGDWDKSLARLKVVDPVYAASLQRNDMYRLKRALFIVEKTGKPLSEFLPKNNPLQYDFRCFFLSKPRDILNRTVDYRCELMLEMGLLQEVAQLLDEGFDPNSPGGRAIGYRQTIQFFDQYIAKVKENSNVSEDILDTLFLRYLEDFQHSSRQYARRQWQWFRKQKFFYWIPKNVSMEENVIMNSDKSNSGSLLETLIHFITESRNEFDNDALLMKLNEFGRLEGSDNFKKLYDYKPFVKVWIDREKRLELMQSFRPWINNRIQHSLEE